MNRRHFLTHTAAMGIPLTISPGTCLGSTANCPIQSINILIGGTFSTLTGKQQEKLPQVKCAINWHTNNGGFYRSLNSHGQNVFGKATEGYFAPSGTGGNPSCGRWPKDKSVSTRYFSWFGDSANPFKRENLEKAANNVLDICKAAQAAGIPNISLFGHSAGAVVANFVTNYSAAMSHPIFFDKLVLLAPGIPNRDAHLDLDRFPNVDAIKTRSFFNFYVSDDRTLLGIFNKERLHYHGDWFKQHSNDRINNLPEQECFIEISGKHHWLPVRPSTWDRRFRLTCSGIPSSEARTIWQWTGIDPIETNRTNGCGDSNSRIRRFFQCIRSRMSQRQRRFGMCQ